jgi:8-oxo-dGTP pyrophosphatase MutT (NUDIX family)
MAAEAAMECWDLLDGDGRPTGRLAIRGKPLPEGGRHLVVHVYLVNPEGRFLIQKRSMLKELCPGAWDVTGGAVLAGEDSRQGALREVEEELGLRLEPEALTLMARLKRPDSFVDIWLGRIEAGIDEMAMQPGEVDDLRFVAAGELLAWIGSPLEMDDAYRAMMDASILGQASSA